MPTVAVNGIKLNIPGLQRVPQRKCIVCGTGADMFCARCLVTPYCSEQCQRRDWTARHGAVCHNLMRLKTAGNASPVQTPDENLNIELPSPPAPLRRPRSPATNRDQARRDQTQRDQTQRDQTQRDQTQRDQTQRDQTQRDRGHNANFKDKKVSGELQRDRGEPGHYNNCNKTRFVPPDHHPAPHRLPRGNTRTNQDSPRGDLTLNDKDEEWENEKMPEQKTTVKPADPTPKPKTDSIPALLDMKIEQQKCITKADTFKANARMGANLSPESKLKGSNSTEVAFVPAQYLIEKLPIGESFVLSVEQPAQSCATKQPGFVCLTMHADYQEQFNLLLGEIFDGEQNIEPRPGSIFAYYDQTDEGWYRARCLSEARCALLDGSRVATITSRSQCRALAHHYQTIPEFCCLLTGNVEVNMSLKCTILMKTAEGYKVSIDAHTEDAYLGEGTITRWIPEVEITTASQPAQTKQENTQAQPEKTRPQPEKAKPQPEKGRQLPETPLAKSSPQIPHVARPPTANGGRYVLLHVTSLARACVRACDDASTAEFESVLQDAALYGVQSGKQLKEPPMPGQVVLCHYEGVHYRALVKRTKAADNRYKVEYVEYGNEEIVPLEKLYVCPPELDLTLRPARATIVQLSNIATTELTQPATDYIETLKEEVEMIATTPNGEKTVLSGSLVQLALAKNKESVNKKLEAMCTPEWKKLEEGGGDVIESAVMLFPDMKTLPLPTTRPFLMDVTDFSNLETGVVCGFENGAKEAEYVYGPLTDRINEYCKSALCNEPYLPMVEELCIARLQPYPQWFRAVVVDHRPGDATATVLYTDYGNIEAEVPIADLRKCMPEFGMDPALAATVDIKDWPKPASPQQIVRAIEFMNIDDEGRGHLPVTRCKRLEDDHAYIIEVPDLIAAINAA